MIDLMRGLLKAIEEGKRGVLVTVAEKSGSAPRESGAKMFITGDGRFLGTIGGGSVEAFAIGEAMKAMNGGRTLFLHYGMDNRTVEQEGMVCGGNVDLFIEPVETRHEPVFRALLEAARKGRRAVVVTPLEGPLSKTIITESGHSTGDALSGDTDRFLAFLKAKGPVIAGGFLVEPLPVAANLFIFGAGHVSQFVARVAAMVNFRVTVIDDRREFANRERFPEADEIIVEDFSTVFDRLRRPGDAYIVIVTRGHKHDAAVLEESLTMNAVYIGMIGSLRKVAIVREHLLTKGVPAPALDRVHAPIGIDIHSETPEEIGVSIVAELIKARAES